MSTKIAAVSMVKNECDIIELFIKINSRFFDKIFILDHFSTDATAEIIISMKEKGFPVIYVSLDDYIFNQSEITSKYCREIASINAFDLVMPIDADEFFCTSDCSAKEGIKDLLSDSGLGLIPWKTYCPIFDTYYSAHAPLFNNFRQRLREPVPYHKVILNNEYAKNCNISMGNHLSTNPFYIGKSPLILPFDLYHAPIRSSEQIIRKTLLGSHQLGLKKNRKPGEAFHWDFIANHIRNNGYHLSDTELMNLSLNYGSNNLDNNNSIDFNSIRIGEDVDSIEFTKLSQINIIESLDRELLSLIKKIRSSSEFQ